MKVRAVTWVPVGSREGGQTRWEVSQGRAPGLTGAGLQGWSRRLSRCRTGPGGLPGPFRLGPDPGEPWGQTCCPGAMGPSGHLGVCQAGPCRPRTVSGRWAWGTEAAAWGPRTCGTGGPSLGCATGAWGLGEAGGQGSGCSGPSGTQPRCRGTAPLRCCPSAPGSVLGAMTCDLSTQGQFRVREQGARLRMGLSSSFPSCFSGCCCCC